MKLVHLLFYNNRQLLRSYQRAIITAEWLKDERFRVPMIEYNDCMLYLQDLIQFQHNDFGLTYGKIIQFFKLVSLLTYVQNPMLSLQEDVVEPQVTVECLLTLDQFVCVNQHVNILYCDPYSCCTSWYYICASI